MTTPNVDVNFRANGLEGVQRGLKLVKDQAEPTGRQWGMASRQIAAGLEAAARQGKVTGESLKTMISSGAEIAFAFGAGGPIVAALAITGVAIHEHITRGMDAAIEKARAFNKELADIARSGDGYRGQDLLTRLQSGDPYAKIEGRGKDESEMDFLVRSRGIAGLRARQKSLRSSEGVYQNVIKSAEFTERTGGTLTPSEIQAAANATQKLRDVRAQLAEVTRILTDQEAKLADAKRVTAPAIQAQLALDSMGGGPLKPNLKGLPPAYAARQGFNDFRIPGGAAGIGKARPEDNPATVAITEGMRHAGEVAGNGFVDTLASTIERGMAKAFEKGANIGGVFAAIGETALAGLGSVAMQIGRQALATLGFIQTIRDSIMNWTVAHPGLGLAAAAGLIALGSALGGAGGRMSANARGAGGYMGGAGYSASSGYGSGIIDRGIIDPTRGAGVAARSANNYSVTIIGPNDPIAQRQLQELMRNAERRGRA